MTKTAQYDVTPKLDQPTYTGASVSQSPQPNQATMRIEIPTENHVRLHGSALALARIGWIFVVVSVVIMFVLSVPPHLKRLTTIYPASSNSYYLLSTAENDALTALGSNQYVYAVIVDGSVLIMLAAFIGFGVLIFLRKSDNWVTILFSFALVMIGITYNTSIESLSLPHPQLAPLIVLVQQVAYTAVLATLFLFPNGRFVARWNAVALAVWVVISAVVVVQTPPTRELAPADTVALLLLVWLMMGIGAQIYRYFRQSNVFERQQTRWMLFGISVAVLGFAVYIILPIVFHDTFKAGLPRVLFNLIGVPLLIAIPALLVPITLGVAVLRHRLWGIDVIINRAVVYTILTTILAIVYFAAIYVLQQIFVVLTGIQQSNIAITASTLTIVALFQPLRTRLQRWVDQRFRVQAPTRLSHTLTQWDEVPSNAANAGRWTGKRLGAYQLYELAGQGGMAEVYRGQHVGLNRTAAVKVMSGQLAQDNDFRKRFEREAQVIASLHHANIVQIYDFGEADGNYYMAMAFINGQTLATYLKDKGVLSLDEALPILRDLASALDYAHVHDVVHRDVKPGNVIFQMDSASEIPGHAILTDFGLAKLISTSSMNSMTEGGVLGTISYLAPEQIDSSQQIGPAADIYALGIVAFQMLTGTLPFSNDNFAAVLIDHLQRPAPDPRQVTESIPFHTALAIVNALAKKPDERWRTATDFVKAMEQP